MNVRTVPGPEDYLAIGVLNRRTTLQVPSVLTVPLPVSRHKLKYSLSIEAFLPFFNEGRPVIGVYDLRPFRNFLCRSPACVFIPVCCKEVLFAGGGGGPGHLWKGIQNTLDSTCLYFPVCYIVNKK